MKYISPGGWFSLEYPMGWHEFEDTEESFLFYMFFCLWSFMWSKWFFRPV